MPFARNWFYMIGVMPASKKNIVDKLRNKDHVSILSTHATFDSMIHRTSTNVFGSSRHRETLS